MTSNPFATYQRTQVVWSFPTGADISLKGGRNLATTNIGTTTLDGITGGLFNAGSVGRLTNPTFLNLPNLSVEFLITPTTMTATGFVLRAGAITGTSPAANVGLGIRLFLSGGTNIVWSMLKRGALSAGGTNNVVQASNATTPVDFNQGQHLVFVAASGQDNRIYLNGTALTLTHSNTTTAGVAAAAGPLFGSIPIDSTYELEIGDPGIPAVSFLGTLGRVIVYPYALSQDQANASVRVQRQDLQVLAVGLGDESSAGGANFGPVAVPHYGGILIGNGTNTIDIDVAGRSFDANGTALTALVPSQGANGQSAIVNNRLRYQPNAATTARLDVIPFRVRDLSVAAGGLISDSIVRVDVSAFVPGTPPIASPDSGYSTLVNTAITIPVTANDTLNGAVISAVSNPPRGSASVSGLNIIYTPDPGLTGADSFTYTLQNSAGNSSATVSLTVEDIVTPPTGDHFIPYPTTANKLVLSTNGTALQNGAALVAAYNGMSTDTRLIIPDVQYDTNTTAGFTFGRTDASAANPIVIQVRNQRYGQAQFLKRVRVTGNDHTIIGLYVRSELGSSSSSTGTGLTGTSNALIGLDGARSRASRCRSFHQGKWPCACFLIAANDCILDFFEAQNTFGGQTGGAPDGRGVGLETSPLRAQIIRGHIHDFNGNTPGSINFHEPIQIGRGGGTTFEPVFNTLVLENRVIDCTNEPEGFSIKSPGNTLRGNCLINGGGQVRFTNRFGEGNRYFANISSNADGFNDRGFSTLFHSNEVRGGTGTIDLNAGEFTKAEWAANIASGGFPASTDADCYYNNCTLRLGPVSGNQNSRPCANPTVRAHTGSVVNTNASGEDINTGANPPAGTPARITPVLLTLADVGPLSADGPSTVD